MNLRWFLFYAFAAISVAGLIWALQRRERIYQFPFLLSAIMIGYFIPQAWVMAGDPLFTPDSAYIPTMVQFILCVAMGYIGYLAKAPYPNSKRIVYDHNKLFAAGLVLLGIGLIAEVKLNLLSGGFFTHFSTKGAYALEWRGMPVYLAFFSRFLIPGLILCFIATLLRPSLDRYAIIAIGLLYPLAHLVFLGRRSRFFTLAVIFLFTLYYFKGYRPSRVQAIAGILIGFLVVVLFPYYRAHTQYDADHTILLEIDPTEVLEEQFSGERVLNMQNAALGVGALDDISDFGWGAGFWNSFVKVYIPRGIFGEEFKNSFLLQTVNIDELRHKKYGQSGYFFMVKTGPGDLFMEFGYLGCVFFYFLGRVFRRIYNKWKIYGDMRCALSLILFTPLTAGLIFGSWTGNLAKFGVPMLFVLLAVDRLARVKHRRLVTPYR